MKVLTLNTWNEQGPWHQRWKLIFEGVERMSPDLIGFQELFKKNWADQVVTKMSFANLVFCQDAGNVIYSRFPVVDQGCKKMLTQSPTEPYWRYLVYAVIKKGQQEIVFFNTHLSWKPEEGGVRMKQIEEVLGLMDEIAQNRDVVLVGDFNAVPESPEIQTLLRRGKLIDSYAQMGLKPEACTWDNRNPYAQSANHELPDRRIDFIFVRSAGCIKKIKNSVIIFDSHDDQGIYASDHYGVLTELETLS